LLVAQNREVWEVVRDGLLGGAPIDGI
jgi:hypothetical protein